MFLAEGHSARRGFVLLGEYFFISFRERSPQRMVLKTKISQTKYY